MVGQEPTALLSELADAGWTETFGFRTVNRLPPVDGVQDYLLSKPGTNLFGGWTPAEAILFNDQAVAILAKHGFPAGIPHRKLSMADLF